MIVALRRRRDFIELSRGGRVRTSGGLRVRGLIDDDLDVARVAFAIPRTVGPAVVRNRVRRRLREVLRQLDGRGELSPGSYLVMVTPSASTASFVELELSLTSLMHRSGVS